MKRRTGKDELVDCEKSMNCMRNSKLLKVGQIIFSGLSNSSIGAYMLNFFFKIQDKTAAAAQPWDNVAMSMFICYSLLFL